MHVIYVTWILGTKVLGGRVHFIQKSAWTPSMPDYTPAHTATTSHQRLEATHPALRVLQENIYYVTRAYRVAAPQSETVQPVLNLREDVQREHQTRKVS